MFRRILVLMTACLAVLPGLRGAPASPQLLRQAVQEWLGERDHWAFTQRAIEYEDGVSHERVERYDPSKPGDARWQLLTVDGKAPTAEQRFKWTEKKFKHHHRKLDASIGDYFDFSTAHVVAETPTLVRFELPIRRDKIWLFPVDKVGVRVTINKQTRALEHLTAHVREPFKVLMGVARVTGGDLDLDFLHFSTDAAAPAASQPAGSARASISKMGERVDFTWSDFKRVNPSRQSADADEQRPGAGDVSKTP